MCLRRKGRRTWECAGHSGDGNWEPIPAVLLSECGPKAFVVLKVATKSDAHAPSSVSWSVATEAETK